MKVLYVKYCDKESVLNICVELENSATIARLVVRRFIEDEQLVTIEPLYFECDLEDKLLNAKVNLDSLMSKICISQSQILNVFLEVDGCEYPISINTQEHQLNAKYNIVKNAPLYKYKPYINSRNSISIFINNVNIDLIFKKHTQLFNCLNGEIQIKVNEYNEFIKYDDINFKLMLRKRAQQNLYEYDEEYCSELVNNRDILEIIDFKLDSIVSDNLSQDDINWDLFVECTINNSTRVIPLVCEIVEKSFIELKDNFFNLEIYTNKNKVISIKLIPKEIIAIANKMYQDNDGFDLDIQINAKGIAYEKLEFICKKRMNVGSGIEYYDIYKENIIDNFTNKSIINANLKLTFLEVLPINQIKEEDIYDLFIRLYKDTRTIDIPIRIVNHLENSKNEYIAVKDEDKTFKLKLYINGKKNLSIYAIYNNITRENTIKIAVIGSCFSRTAFTSTPFFNPKYKELFQVVETDFHSSIISEVSEPTDIDVDKVSSLNPKNIQFILNDFNKSIFDRLKKAEVDYIILDFYSDAIREVIYFDEDRCVSGSIDLRSTQYYKDLNDVKILDHRNNKKYFEVWKDAIEKFMEKVEEIVPQDKIILNKTNFIEVYKDKDNSIKKFYKEEKINRNKYFFDKLNNYYIFKFPKSPILDMTKSNYIGVHNHPLGNTYSHYESEYYKLFMTKLVEIIFKDNLDKFKRLRD